MQAAKGMGDYFDINCPYRNVGDEKSLPPARKICYSYSILL
jgi:hypothetical protein